MIHLTIEDMIDRALSRITDNRDADDMDRWREAQIDALRRDKEKRMRPTYHRTHDLSRNARLWIARERLISKATALRMAHVQSKCGCRYFGNGTPCKAGLLIRDVQETADEVLHTIGRLDAEEMGR